MAWCSGALSTSLMQLQAAVALGSITDSVRSRLLACAEVRVDSFPTDDAALCHGSLGHAYMFHRGWLATGEAKLRDAANQWTAYALAQRSADPSLPGFVRVKSGKALNHGFTEGKVGIALALLTLAGVISPTWDGLLGFSVPLPRRN